MPTNSSDYYNQSTIWKNDPCDNYALPLTYDASAFHLASNAHQAYTYNTNSNQSNLPDYNDQNSGQFLSAPYQGYNNHSNQISAPNQAAAISSSRHPIKEENIYLAQHSNVPIKPEPLHAGQAQLGSVQNIKTEPNHYQYLGDSNSAHPLISTDLAIEGFAKHYKLDIKISLALPAVQSIDVKCGQRTMVH